MRRLRPIACCARGCCPIAAFAEVAQAPLGEAVERQLPGDEQFMQWTRDPERLATQAGDELATREVVVAAPETVKLQNVVPPIHFESGVAEVPDSTVAELRKALDRVRDKKNVRLHLVGHADTQPLSPSLAERYGDNEGLSRERAGEVAELFQAALALPPEAISYEWAGASQPVAQQRDRVGPRRQPPRRGGGLVRRDRKTRRRPRRSSSRTTSSRSRSAAMETVCKLRYIEGQERRARVQNLVAPLHYERRDRCNRGSVRRADRSGRSQNLRDKQNVMVKFIGYTDNTPLAGRDERIYGDARDLSKARAHRVALAMQEELGAARRSGRERRPRRRPRRWRRTRRQQGRALNRRVEVEFWYDDPLQELPDEPQLCPGDAGRRR